MLSLLCQPGYKKMFGEIEKKYSVAEWIDHYGFYVGCHHGLKKDDMDKIVEAVHAFLKSSRQV